MLDQDMKVVKGIYVGNGTYFGQVHSGQQPHGFGRLIYWNHVIEGMFEDGQEVFGKVREIWEDREVKIVEPRQNNSYSSLNNNAASRGTTGYGN